jgi:hypothetical protein
MSEVADKLRARLANIPDQSQYEGWSTSAHVVRLTWAEAAEILIELDKK